MRDKKEEDHIAASKIGAQIMDLERNWGSFVFLADGPRLFDGVTRRVIEINGRSDTFQDWLGGRYGLLWNDHFTKLVANFVRIYASMYGTERETRRFSYFDPKTKTLYLSRWNGSAYKLDGESITIVPNGQNVLFVDDGAGIPIEADVGNHGELRAALVDDLNFVSETAGGVTPEAQADLFAIWMHSVGFADATPTKQVLLVEGEQGSGKTYAIKRLQTVLTGRSRPIAISSKNGEDDFCIQLLHSDPIALIDNVDSKIDWLRTGITLYATQGTWLRRKKYTDVGLVEIRPSAFIAISSNNAVSFRITDIANRCVVIRLGHRTSNTPEGVMNERLAAARSRLYGEWLWNLNRCVAIMRTNTGLGGDQATRMADAAWFAQIAGTAFGLPPERVQTALTLAEQERRELMLEDEPLRELLETWVELGNGGRPVTVQTLLTELCPIMTAKGLEPYPSPRALAAKIREKAHAMSPVISIVRSTTRAGSYTYTFTLPPS